MAASLIAPVLVLLAIWSPEIAHVRAPRASIGVRAPDTARTAPADSVLNELRSHPMLPIEGRDRALDLSVAESILRGRLELPGMSVGQLSLPFSVDDLDGLPPSLRLWYAGFVVPDFLLAAFAESEREEFFVAARDFIGAWDAYERRAWLPKGLLWNDHAIAARVRVLAEFWRIYRERPDYDPVVGRAVLEQAARYGHFLSTPGQFTFSTNHGVMQNLGLLQLSLAFPSLPESGRYRRIARERLDRQMSFFIDAQGVIRENSAGYQAFGLEILGMTFRTMTLLGDPIPADWVDRYRAGLRVLETIRRPDGTLPSIGDTDAASIAEYPRVTDIDAAGRSSVLRPFLAGAPGPGETLYAPAGYWINWDGLQPPDDPTAASQLAVAWTTPPAPGHKHADEMSVHLWAAGSPWLTGIGYWPYTDEGRGLAESWTGSNAPHRREEGFLSERTTRFLTHGSTGPLALADLQRSGPGSYRARRQVVQADRNTWVTLDLVAGDSSLINETVWTLGSDVELERKAEGVYELRSQRAAGATRLDFVASPGTSFTEHRGSRTPLAGWNVVRSIPVPAFAIAVAQPGAASWLATVVTRSSGASALAGPPRLTLGAAADDWVLSLPHATGGLEVRRSGDTLITTRQGSAGSSADTLVLSPGPDVTTEIGAVREAFDSMAAEFPRFRSMVPTRAKVSLLLLLLFLGQEVVLFAARRWWPRAAVPLRTASLLFWIGLGAWLHSCFLQSWETVTPQMGFVPLLFRRPRFIPPPSTSEQ